MSPAIQELDRSPDRRIEEIRRQLKELGHLWIGEDIRVARDYRLEPGETTQIEVILPENSLPPIDYDEGDISALLGELRISIKSRLALSGFDGGFVELNELESGLQGRKIRGLSGVMPARILGGRPIKLTEGREIACLWATHGARMLTGKELYQKVVEEQKIKIGGVFGEEWCLMGQGNFFVRGKRRAYPHLSIRDKRWIHIATEVGLRLKDKRFRIAEGTEPINVYDIDNYRDYLDCHVFVEMGSEEHAPFWVGETISVVKIPLGYNGALGLDAIVGNTWAFQTNSHLIRGGKTNWPLRSEFQAKHGASLPTSDDYLNQHLVMYVFEDRRLASQ